MSLDFTDRCAIAAACLPKAGYRTQLEKLHAEMLAALAVRVPLTDDQIAGLLDRTFSDNTLQPDDLALIRAIEAAHGITAAKEHP